MNVSPELIIGGAAIALIIYLAVTHKITAASLKADMVGAHDKLDQIIHRNTANDAAPKAAPAVPAASAPPIEAAAPTPTPTPAPAPAPVIDPPKVLEAPTPNPLLAAYTPTPEIAAILEARVGSGAPAAPSGPLDMWLGQVFGRGIPIPAKGFILSDPFTVPDGAWVVQTHCGDGVEFGTAKVAFLNSVDQVVYGPSGYATDNWPVNGGVYRCRLSNITDTPGIFASCNLTHSPA